MQIEKLSCRNSRPNFAMIFWSCILSVLWSSQVLAWQQTLEEIHAEALARINENSVAASLSFLASDELGGRGTGTHEYTLAAAYVASRFQAAGLKGGGDEGTFYHEREIQLSRLPGRGIEFANLEGQPLPHLGMLAAVDDAVVVQGPVQKLDLRELPEDGTVSEIVTAIHRSSARQGRGLQAILANSAARLKARGAKALILAVDPNDGLVESARQSSLEPRVVDPRTNFAIPILLVDQAVVENLNQVKITLPPRVLEPYRAKNVVGLIRGTDPELAAEAVVFSAHLDHLGRQPGQPDQIFNGADDNASGVTAILTLADAFTASPIPPKRSILFIAFWGEESGLLGSRDFANRPSWPLEKITANINIEMIGRPEPGATKKIWVTGWEKSNLGSIMNEASQAIGITIFDHPQFSSMLYRSSDNWSFAEKGVIAHSFSAGSLHSDYHQTTDTWDKLDTEHMTNVIRGLYIGSLPLTSGTATPSRKDN